MQATAAVTPISGYLLPDHMDESLEVFDRFGNPIGELLHDAISDAVTWEPAPGRAVPPDAGPLTGIPGEFGSHAQHAAMLAAGLIRADVDHRHSGAPAARSALSALLRTIDSTLWSIDTFQAIGSPTIAGLVGRPVAVVRATLRLDAPDDVDEVNVLEATAPTAAAPRSQRSPGSGSRSGSATCRAATTRCSGSSSTTTTRGSTSSTRSSPHRPSTADGTAVISACSVT